MILLCYPKCSTCQKATKYLDELNIQYTYHDIKLNNPSYNELKEWYQLSKQDLKKFFNRGRSNKTVYCFREAA